MSMSTRHRLFVGVAIGLALAIGAAGGALGYAAVKSAGPVKAIKVAVADGLVFKDDDAWFDVPGMALSMTVPAGEHASLLITFSANELCTSLPDAADTCFGLVRVLVNGAEVTPGEVTFAEGYRSTAGGYSSAQFITDSLGPGKYNVKVQFRQQGDGAFNLTTRTLTVERAKV